MRLPEAVDDILSGGFVANPVTTAVGRAKIKAARFLPGPLYRNVVLRMHAAALESPFDATAELPLTTSGTRDLFLANTPWQSYVARGAAALRADYADRLDQVEVPTLILTPAHDTLIGEDAATQLRTDIPDAVEHVLPRTGHMFRFIHPTLYASHVEEFLSSRSRSTNEPELHASTPAGRQAAHVVHPVVTRRCKLAAEVVGEPSGVAGQASTSSLPVRSDAVPSLGITSAPLWETGSGVEDSAVGV